MKQGRLVTDIAYANKIQKQKKKHQKLKKILKKYKN